MRHLPDRRVLIRWMFNALGYLLIFGHRFVIRTVLHAGFWGELLFGKNTAGYFFWMAAATIYTLPTALLCWLTAAGLKRNKRWAFGVGVATCGLLILGFPWFTFAGGLGLYVLLTTSPAPAPAAIPAGTRPSTDYWGAKRRSKAQAIVQSLLWFGVIFIQIWFSLSAQRAGMPEWHPGWKLWFWMCVFIFVNTALHESGHAIVAWAVGFTVRVFSIGPVTFWRGGHGPRFRIDWGRLFDGGGYIGAVPVCDRNLRWNEIAIIAAGPVTNALVCLISLDVFFALPGTAWQGWWWVAALNACAAGLMAIGNLIPVGYCDGTMLFHLILNTPAGRLLLDHRRVTEIQEEAIACHDRADFEKEIALKQAMLDRALEAGPENAFVIAACHQALGSAYVQIDEWTAAELHYRKSLEFEGELAANPTLAANVWCGLQLVAVRRLDSAAAGSATASALALLERQRSTGPDRNGPALTLLMIAQVHERNGSYRAALREIEQAFRVVAGGAGTLSLRAHLLRLRALCSVGANDIEAGIAAAEEAAGLFRSGEVPGRGRNLAWENIADLGAELCRTGLAETGLDLLHEGIEHLEAGGARFVAARFRIKLAQILLQAGRIEEAGSALPDEQALAPRLRRPYLAARAELHLARGQCEPAIADARELAELWRADPLGPVREVSCAEALLAKAWLAAGDFATAEALAAGAAEVLGPLRHPAAAGCVITVALARSQAGAGWDRSFFRAGLELIESAALIGAAEKARLRRAESARLRDPVAV
jgi:tetratricopeptide (TPR) repeat protein